MTYFEDIFCLHFTSEIQSHLRLPFALQVASDRQCLD